MDESKPATATTPWHRSPFWLGVIGLSLMLTGYQLSRFVPGNKQVAGLRAMSDDAAFRARLDEVEKNNAGDPPYRLPGLFLLLAGATSFVSAGVLMTRKQPRPTEETREEEVGVEGPG